MREMATENREAQLLATLRAECDRLTELLALARREYEVVAEDDFSALFSIVQSRQAVLAQIEEHQRELTRLLGADRFPTACLAPAERVKTVLAQIIQQDFATRCRLESLRAETALALRQLDLGARALNAYHQSHVPTPVACDLKG